MLSLTMRSLSLVLTLLLTSSPLSALTFAEWTASHSLSGSAALPDADPDGDRVPNLMEFALAGMDPTALDAGSLSMPTVVFARRNSTEIGEWEYAGTQPPTDGLDGVFHTALLFTPRPGTVGIRYIPEVSDSSSLKRWFDGCSVLRSEVLPTGSIMSVALTQGQRYKRFFIRLSVIEDEGITDPLAGFTVNGQAGLAVITQPATAQPRIISGGSSSSITVQDIVYTRTTGATTVTDWIWQYIASPYNFAPVTVTRSADPALLTPSSSDPYLWTFTGNGAVQLTMSTETSTYRTNVTNSTATGQTVDTWASNVSGTLRHEADAEIDTAIAGKNAETSQPLWTVRTPSTLSYSRNAQSWGAGYDLTPHAAYNSATVAYQPLWGGVTLVSPRHIIGAAHTGHPQAGCTYHFVKADGTACVRTCTAASTVGSTDIRLGILASDVDSGISFARVLPDTWAVKLPTLALRHIACARINRQQRLILHELHDLAANAVFQAPLDSTRATFHITPVSGDSGSPLFLVIDGKMVLLTTLYSASGGPSLISQRSAINAALTALGGSYQLTNADVSSYTSF